MNANDQIHILHEKGDSYYFSHLYTNVWRLRNIHMFKGYIVLSVAILSPLIDIERVNAVDLEEGKKRIWDKT